MMKTRPTPYAEINALLELLLLKQQAILGASLIGLYLFGSLATGDFTFESSDIDFIAALATERDNAAVTQLQHMHKEIATTVPLWGKRLEGAYISLAALRRYDPAYQQPSLGPDRPFCLTELGADWVINRWTVREQGVIVYGPDPKTLIDVISDTEIQAIVRQELASWQSFRPEPPHRRTRRYQSYVILTVCRALYALAVGTIGTKPRAAAWAMQQLDPRWRTLIQSALAWQADETMDEVALIETMLFLHYATAKEAIP
jgi:predicted nucleotidyltransferase